MLLLVAARLLAALFPYRLLAPDWYVSLGLELANSSPVVILGFMLLSLASWRKAVYTKASPIKPGDSKRLMIAIKAAAWIYLLVIPVQLFASVLGDINHRDRLKAEWQIVEDKIAAVRQKEDGGPQIARLEKAERQLLDMRRRGQRRLRLTLIRDWLRVLVSAAAVIWLLRLAGRLVHG